MAPITPLHRRSQEFGFEPHREDSFDALPDTGPAQKVNEDPQELRESSKKASKAKKNMDLALIGCPPRPGTRGQLIVDTKPFYDPSSPMYRPSSDPSFHVWNRGNYNFWACFPVINVFFGISNIFAGVFTDGSYYNVAPDDKWKFKVLSVIGGILELTLIGGWIVHGIATLYFYKTDPSEEEIQLMHEEWAAKKREKRNEENIVVYN